MRIVGIGDMAFSDDPADQIVTYSLGSCMGIALWDPVRRIGGLAHCLLPLSGADRRKAARSPATYVDSGVAALLQSLFDRGAARARLVAHVAGCGQMSADHDLFRVGEKNLAVATRILAKNSIRIGGRETGGSIPRTLSVDIADGRVRIRSPLRERVYVHGPDPLPGVAGRSFGPFLP